MQKKKKRRLLWLLLCLVLFSGFFYFNTGITWHAVKVPEEQGSIEVFFCQQANCTLILQSFIQESEEPKCAFYDLKLGEVIRALENKKVGVIIDNNNDLNINTEKRIDSYGLMHNKFCVSEKKVITGSMNPTYNGAYRNDNNLILIESKTIAKNYKDEFNEMWNGKFKGGKKTKQTKVIINNTLIENYFCPEDNCAYEIMEELSKAEKSIYFMTFSFTHNEIGDVLVKKHEEGIKVSGIFEKRQDSKYSQKQRLEDANIAVYFDKNTGAMHHKVFIIDNKTVITGSMNPSKNGDKRNDENIIVIHDRETAEKFMREYERISKG